jgi:hypothetical protein
VLASWLGPISGVRHYFTMRLPLQAKGLKNIGKFCRSGFRCIARKAAMTEVIACAARR